MEDKHENLSLYVVDELSEQEREEFENHLRTCIHCQQELDFLQETWQALSYDVNEVDVPVSLKSEVMNSIFEEDEIPLKAQVKETKKNSLVERIKVVFTKHFSPLSACFTAFLAIGLIVLFLNNLELKDTITALEKDAFEPTQQIVTTFTLKGKHSAASANGTAYLIQEGSDTSLVVALNHMPSTKNDEVYQVWLLKDGNRQNAGTLRPDQNGNGFISYRLPKDYSFDNIGITLEPNPHNIQPKGQKVMGTS
jgi:anti-sigma factor RsiW